MYQQRRTAPAVSAYESQAARWKQGFSAPGQPGHPHQQQQQQTSGARHSDLEGVLIGELCSSIGSSSFPPRDVLQKLVRYLPSLDHSVRALTSSCCLSHPSYRSVTLPLTIP